MQSAAPMYLILCLVLFPSQGANKKQIFKTYRIAYNTVKQVSFATQMVMVLR